MEEYTQNAEENAPTESAELKEDEQFLNQDVPMDAGMIGYPEPKPIGKVYALFQEVLNMPSSTKVSNLEKPELGDMGITVRDSLRIALIANTFRHPTFARFFLNQAGITTDTAMSKKGWLAELFVTSKKFAQRDSSSNFNLPQQQQPTKKWTLFGKNQTPQ